MELINITLISYIANQLFYNKLTSINNKNDCDNIYTIHTELIKYVKKNINKEGNKVVLYQYIIKNIDIIKYSDYIFDELFVLYDAKELLKYKTKKSIYLLLYFLYIDDYDKYKNILCSLSFKYINKYIFLNIICKFEEYYEELTERCEYAIELYCYSFLNKLNMYLYENNINKKTYLDLLDGLSEYFSYLRKDQCKDYYITMKNIIDKINKNLHISYERTLKTKNIKK